MFVRSIMVMKDDAIPKRIFCEKARVYFLNPLAYENNRCNSAVVDLLNVRCIFGLLGDVRDMVERLFFFPEATWRDKVWKKGWDLEDTYWRIESQLHRSLDLLSNTYPSSIYLVWWSISDKYPMLMKKCEILSKIVCHASLLRVDDFSLKDHLNTFKMCELCNDFEIKDARHIVLLCPFFQNV